MKYLSLFSGVGGFELGIQRAFDNRPDLRNGSKGLSEDNTDTTQPQVRAECIGYSEIDKYAIETYKSHFKEHKNYGDATLINERTLPDFDLLVGGFPCQAFSIAGKRLGFDETRGTLFFDIARILKHKRPRHLVLENVKGLLSHDGGKTFTTIIGVLTNLGYCVEWQVLNAKDFGVPQNRERVFIVGNLRGECGRQVFPISGQGTATSFSNTIRSGGKGSLSKKHAWDLVQFNLLEYNHQDNRVRTYTTTAPTVQSSYGTGGGHVPFVVPVLTPDRLEKRQNGRRFKENGEPSFTLNTQDKHGIYDGAKIRRLTPLECERLMSWPDNWTIGSDTQRYKQCGNGVVSNCVQAVVEKLLPCLIK